MNFTEEDLEIIAKYHAEQISNWDDEELKVLKSKIKEHLKTNFNEQCCYCKRGFEDEFNMVIDIEHILPKSKFRALTFDIKNLNLSCKRCNMKIKKERIDFLVDKINAYTNRYNPNNYLLIHPNLDIYKENLNFINFTLDDEKFIKYIPLSAKGKFNYKYFYLDKIERSTFNLVQGTKNNLEFNSENIQFEIFEKLDNILKKM